MHDPLGIIGSGLIAASLLLQFRIHRQDRQSDRDRDKETKRQMLEQEERRVRGQLNDKDRDAK